MEIVKTNETYQISDTKVEKGWEMTGTATKGTIGSIGISFSVMKPGELVEELVEEIGSGNYNLEPNSDRININYSTYESTKADFVEYMEEIVSAVKTHFSE